MRAVILDGTRDGRELENHSREVLLAEIGARADEVRTFALRDMDIGHCLGCFGCWIKTPGECVIEDDAREITRAVAQSDLVIYLTPVTFGGFSSDLKKVLDRNISLIQPDFTVIDGETHHKKRYARYPAMLGIGTLPEPDAEAERIFTTLIERNALNMHGPQHAAGVLLADADADTRRTAIAALLQEVGL